MADSIEEWRPVLEFEDRYLISNFGRVKSIFGKSEGQIKPFSRHSYGYPIYTLYKNGKYKCFAAHKLVALNFIGPRPAGMFICHIDGDCDNNHVENLRYATPKENQADRKRHGTYQSGETVTQSVLTEEQVLQAFDLKRSGVSAIEISRRFGVHRSTISYLLKGKNWVALDVERFPPQKVRRHSQEEIAYAKFLIERGAKVEEVIDKIEIARSTYYRIKTGEHHSNIEAKEPVQ